MYTVKKQWLLAVNFTKLVKKGRFLPHRNLKIHMNTATWKIFSVEGQQPPRHLKPLYANIKLVCTCTMLQLN